MAPKIFIVNSQIQADYKVCYVNSPGQQKNHQLIEGGKLVKYSNQADIKIFFVKNTIQADILIMPKNFPK